jgi:ATP-dependent DNA helicase RecG
VMKFLLRYCDLWDKRPRNFPADEIGEAPVQARGNYSIGVVREAIANALTHRDLTIRDHVTRVQIFDRSIEVINPRRSYGFTPFSTRAIRYGIPQRLNPELSSIFKSPAYGLETATGGMPVLLRASRAFSGKRADIHAVNDEFHLRIYGA